MKESTTLIGITGNIATGKSVVRRMLANAGALGLDADTIAHRMIYPQSPVFQDVVDTFGEEILNERGEISRAKLGEIVFQNLVQLEQLESIVHPAVTGAIQTRLKHSLRPLAALEAIKLLEAGLGEICDAVWVSHVPAQKQLERLLQTRGMTEDEAGTRIDAQPPQVDKLDQADAVIHTDGSFESTWAQVIERLNATIQVNNASLVIPGGWKGPSVVDLDPDELLSFWEAHTGNGAPRFYEVLGMEMAQPVTRENQLQAILLWKNWNFTATLTQVLPAEFLLANFVTVMETFLAAARRAGCEITLLPDELVQRFELKPESLGFQHRKPDDLPYPAWRIAANEVKLTGKRQVWSQVLAEPLEATGNFKLK